MGFFANGELVYQVATTATSGGTTTLSATSLQVQDFTGSSNQIVKLPPTTSMYAGQSYQIYNSSTGTLTMQYQDGTSFGLAPTVSPNTSLTVTLLSTGTSNGTWSVLSGSGSGASSGSKNYLSTYTASTSSSTPNSGNGNFENGSTSGWSLAHSSLTSNFPSTVGSGGNAFSSAGGVHGGSAANANLSLSVVSSNQLAGSYSASYSSSTATTAGDMIISDAFFIDIEDQANIMQFSIAYKAQTNPSNGNFSGTSSNSFAVAIYDVTNNAWIMPAGVYNLVQNSGVGLATGTFQTTSNSTQYQIALYNANASSGAITLYLDDFFLGPQIVQKGPAMSDWSSSQLTFTPVSFGTTTNNTFYWKREGDTIHVRGFWTNGTVTGGVASITLPLAIDTTKMGSAADTTLGIWEAGNGTTSSIFASAGNAGTIIYDGSTTGSVFLAYQVATGNPIKNTASSFASTGQPMWFDFSYPVAGWSSNSVMSQDTDTRVIAAQYFASTAQSANGVINFDTKVTDTAGAVTTGSSWKFVAPVTGIYNASATAALTSNGTACDLAIYKNGSLYRYISGWTSSDGTSYKTGGTQVPLNAGDYIDFRGDTAVSANGNGSGTLSSISINRLSGPAVITATESVNCRYSNTAGTSVTSTPTAIPFATKSFDSHDAFSGSTYTVPVSGKYQVSAALQAAFSSAFECFIYKNGSQYDTLAQAFNSGTDNVTISGSDLVSCNAGDTLQIYAVSTNSITLNTSAGLNYINVVRIGN